MRGPPFQDCFRVALAAAGLGPQRLPVAGVPGRNLTIALAQPGFLTQPILSPFKLMYMASFRTGPIWRPTYYY